jgi:hypothetical protein
MPAPLVNLGPYATAKTHTWGIGQSWRWPDFSPFELRQRQTGVVVIDPSFLDRLQRLRDAYDKPMPVTSYYRSPEYNDVVSSSGQQKGAGRFLHLDTLEPRSWSY